jgi:hypothetical protein
MRKRVYWVLRALYHDDMVSGYTCKLDGMSSRVRNEIYDLRKVYKVKITGCKSYVGRHNAYFIDTSVDNMQRAKTLLETFKKENF